MNLHRDIYRVQLKRRDGEPSQIVADHYREPGAWPGAASDAALALVVLILVLFSN